MTIHFGDSTSIASGSGLGDGKVVQVVTASYATSVTLSGSGGDTGLTCSIDPTKASSKILVLSAQEGEFFVSSDPSCVINLYILRNVAGGSYSTVQEQQYLGGSFPTNRRSERITTLIHLDTPSYSVGNTLNYKMKASGYTSSYGLKYRAQHHGSTNPSHMILMEIAT